MALKKLTDSSLFICTRVLNSFSLSSSFCCADDLAYEVRWLFTRLRGGETTTQVASVDRFGVVRKETRNSSSDLSVERKDTHTYTLSVHGTQDRWVSSTATSATTAVRIRIGIKSLGCCCK